DGRTLTLDEAVWLAEECDAEELFKAAHALTHALAPRRFNLCTIVNAKSGRCGEDCRWCAQSSRYQTGVKVFPIIDRARSRAGAERAAELGISRFSYVTSGRKLSARELREVHALAASDRDVPGIELCASLGLLTQKELRELKDAGLVRYHCNLETGPAFFSKVCSTHTQTDKIATLRAARRVGLEICSGGLFGMGETMRNRAELALLLRSLSVPSIPLNFLVPIPGTPLENQPPLSDEEVLRIVALFRFANPTAYLRFAGGRMRLSDETVRRALWIGVNSAITGDLLTTCGSAVEEDRKLAAAAGYIVE
ncbi:MAG: biotin synthase BioB, partial [Sutterella sp.]